MPTRADVTFLEGAELRAANGSMFSAQLDFDRGASIGIECSVSVDGVDVTLEDLQAGFAHLLGRRVKKVDVDPALRELRLELEPEGRVVLIADREGYECFNIDGGPGGLIVV